MPDFRDYLTEAPQEIIDALNQEHSAVDPEGGQGTVPSTPATATTSELHLYVDSSRPDDSGVGLSWGTAKKTIQAAFNAIPNVVRHNVMVHLRGTFTFAGWPIIFLHKYVAPASSDDWGVKVVVSGDEAPTVLEGPHTSDINSVSSIGLSTAGWTIDEHAGYHVEILTGPATGDRRRVFSNTATTIVPSKDFSVDPGVGAQFRVTRPATEITGSMTLACIGGGGGWCHFQNLFLSGDAGFFAQHCPDVRISNTIINYSWGARSSGIAGVEYVVANDFSTEYSPGLTCLTRVAGVTGWLINCEVSLFGAHLSGIDMVSCTSASHNLSAGTRIIGPVFASSYHPADSAAAPMLFGGTYASHRGNLIENASGVGLTLEGSSLRMGVRGVEISNCGSHAVELDRSRIRMLNANLSGSGNTGAGVYAHSHSSMLIKDGAPPTVVGTVGDLSTDGTTEEVSWATLDAGTKLADANEFVIAKEVA
jgi:hypothetical protein